MSSESESVKLIRGMMASDWKFDSGSVPKLKKNAGQKIFMQKSISKALNDSKITIKDVNSKSNV